MVTRRDLTGGWIVTTLLVLFASLAQANNPNSSNPYWNGPNGESVDMLSGELRIPVTDISIQSRGGLSINFTRTYNSELQILNPTSGGKAIPGDDKPVPVNFSEGWHFPIVKIIDNGNMIMYEHGGYESFFRDDQGRKKTRQFGVVMHEDWDSLVIQYADGTRWMFGRELTNGFKNPYNGRYLRTITAPGGHSRITYDYKPILDPSLQQFTGSGGVLWKISDDAGRYVELLYNNYNGNYLYLGSNRVAEIRYLGNGGQVRSIYYDYQNSLLSRVRYSNGDTVDYAYTDQYYDDTSIGYKLLSKISFPSGAAMRYEYESFEQIWVDRSDHCYVGTEPAVTENFALKHAILSDKSDDDVDTVIFNRTYTGYSLTSQYAISCSDCAGSEEMVTEFRFYPISLLPAECGANVSTDLDFGLPEYCLRFKGSWNGSRYSTSASTVDKDSIAYNYEWYVSDCNCTSSARERGWKLTDLGDNTYYPFLSGYLFHPHEMPADYREYPQLGVSFDSDFGTVVASCENGDSVSKVLDAIRDVTGYRYRVLQAASNGTCFEHHYKYNTANPAFVDTIYTIRVIPDQNPSPPDETFRDTVRARFEHDQYGNITKTWDDIGFANQLDWRESVSYDGTSTYATEATDRYGSIATSSVDWRLGQINWTESPSGLRTTNYYDSADRLAYVWREGDPDTTLKIKYYEDGNRKLVSEFRTLSATGTYNLTRSWSDIWGRPIADTAFEVYGQYLSSDWHSVSFKEYNRIGQLIRSSRPRRSTESADSTVWTYFSYDSWGRLKETDSPDYRDNGQTLYQNKSRITYDGQYVTSYGWDNRAMKTKVDRYGRITNIWCDSVGVQDWQDHGTTTYFQSTSLPTTITSPNGDNITYGYDKWLRPTSVTKKDEGISRTYSDKRGLVRLAKDANGLWTYFTYDKLARLIETGTSVISGSDTLLINDFNYIPASRVARMKSYYGQYFNPPAQIHDSLASSARYNRNDYNNHPYIKGMLTQVEDPACITYFVYDMYGRTTLKIIQFKPVTVPNGPVLSPRTKFIAYTYNLRNQILAVRYPDEVNNTVVYEYHKSGKLQEVPGYVDNFADIFGNAPGFRYNGWGGLEQIHGSDWLSEYISYDSLSRIAKVGVEAIIGEQPFAESYAFEDQYLTRVYKENSPVGNPAWNQLVRTHSYDYRGRVKRVRYEAPSVEIHGYAYDDANNRVADTTITTGTVVNHYNLYDNSHRLKNVSTIQGLNHERYTYDNNGNMLVDSSKGLTFDYDYRNLIQHTYRHNTALYLTNLVDTIVYAYNAQNQRVMKLQKYWYLANCPVGGGEDFMVSGNDLDGGGPGDPPLVQCPFQNVVATFYVWSGNEIIAEYDVNDSLAYQYIYANGRRIATVRVGINHSKYPELNHYDGFGSLRRVTSILEGYQGHALQQLDYDIWGNIRALAGLVPAFTYAGQEWDDESGINLFYLRNRYYDPAIGRFTTPDPMVSDLNPYAYCGNNPIMMSDPNGLMPRRGGGHPGQWRPGDPIPPGTRNNSGYDPNDPRINNGEPGQGRTDPAGNPLFTDVGPDAGSGWYLRAVTTSGTVGDFVSNFVHAIQAGGQYASKIPKPDGSEPSYTPLLDAVLEGYSNGLIGDEMLDVMLSLMESGLVGFVDLEGPIGGQFLPNSDRKECSTILLDIGLLSSRAKDGQLLANFAKESYHYGSFNNHTRMLDEMDGIMRSRQYDSRTYIDGNYSPGLPGYGNVCHFCSNGPNAWLAFNMIENYYGNFSKKFTYYEAAEAWRNLDGQGGCKGIKCD